MIPLIAIIAGTAYYVGVVRMGQQYIRALQTLRVEDVDQVLLDGRPLPSDKVPQFLSLLSSAVPYSPNHPIHYWRVPVTILRHRPLTKMHFPIYGCRADGVQINLFSWGGDSGWYYGTLRNDDLGSFLREVAAIHSNQAMEPTAGRFGAYFHSTSTLPLRIGLALATGGSSCSR
jgi:hypothetical protein